MRTFEIANAIGGTLQGDPDVEILGIASQSEAGAAMLSFTFDSVSSEISAGCLIAPEGSDISQFPKVACLISARNPKLAFAKAFKFFKAGSEVTGISPSAIVSANSLLGSDVSVGHGTVIEGAEVGDMTSIGSGCYIGKGVRIGQRCRVSANVTINDDCEIGDDAIIHAGVVIGSDGLGFVQDTDGSHVKFPQVGKVIVGSNVEIGANTCIDRGSLGDTEIGDGSKIDNLVQIAHNVKIGKRVILAAQVGIAGSSKIGDDCVLAGQVGIADHVELRSGTAIGGKSLVNSGKILRGGVWWGVPVRPIEETKRILAEGRNIEGLGRTLKEILREIELLKSRIN
jgi:UDP-3-O-[3-hydroxymyristoyl] glucosamine N-acyltransferase